MFDFANPDLHIPQRAETTVPQQALFTMNHPLVLDCARSLAAVSKRQTAEETIAAMFERTYQRMATKEEISDALKFVTRADKKKTQARLTAVDWQYGYGAFNEASKRVAGFTPLPHFTGSAWQGGAQWPDDKFGWVQLTATGGHPGNDLSHACIRRWTAPRKMTIRIESKLVHDAALGDGIRAFVVSSRAAALHAVTIHRKTVDLNVASLDVEQGETIDFVVDIGGVLNNDQYLWTATIHELAAAKGALSWKSHDDFPANIANRLTAWELLAQVLMCTNEFVFVD
jgi:hypothetical protein